MTGIKVMSDSDISELKALTYLLEVLSNGIVIPNNIKYAIRNIENAEQETGLDLTDLKKCCSPSANVREAKDFKPYIKPLLERISLIANLKLEKQDPIFGDRKNR